MSAFVKTARRLLQLSNQQRIFSMNPLNAEVYELKGQIFRRNVPLEQINQLSAPSTSENIITADFADDADQEGCSVVIESTKDEILNEHSSVSDEESGQESAEPEKDTTTFIKYDSAKNCYHTSFQVPVSQVGSLIGFKGSNKQKLEKATNCKLVIDKSTGNIGKNKQQFAWYFLI
uniref:K Homology domain-containing protein n=1 Tax=Ditylenchus dipsaci TaxID=166011 RepID=A0A915EV88_9BILA